jgi:hypothetical protein
VAVSRVTRKELEEWSALEAQRLQLQRQVKDLAALQEVLEEKFFSHVVANGGPERVVLSCGYRLRIDTKRGTVQWKNELVKIAGTDKAEELIAAAPAKDVLVIEPPK